MSDERKPKWGRRRGSGNEGGLSSTPRGRGIYLEAAGVIPCSRAFLRSSVAKWFLVFVVAALVFRKGAMTC